MCAQQNASFTLPTEIAKLIRTEVQEGGYASNSEVIWEAMRAWQAQEQLRAERLTEMRAKIAEVDADLRPSMSDECSATIWMIDARQSGWFFDGAW